MKSSSIMDFYVVLRGLKRNPAPEPTIEDLIMVLRLCERLFQIRFNHLSTINFNLIRSETMWMRIYKIIKQLHGNKKNDEVNAEQTSIIEPILTYKQFKNLIWFLIGIEEEQLDDSVLENQNLNFSM